MFETRIATKDSYVWVVLHENWGYEWQGGEWDLVCPRCGKSKYLSELFRTFRCSSCTTEFEAHRAHTPVPRMPIPLWVIATYLVDLGASARQLGVLSTSHKTSLKIGKFVRRKLGLPDLSARAISSHDLLRAIKALYGSRVLESATFRRKTTRVLWDIQILR